MAYDTIKISSKDFGLSKLRKGINRSDPEKVLDALKDVNKNIKTYNGALTEQGFTDTLNEQLTNAYTSIESYRQQQYEIQENRKALVQSSIGTFNELYDLLKEILKIGKILYKDKDPVKRQEYTFSNLKKQVRRILKEKKENTKDSETSEENSSQE